MIDILLDHVGSDTVNTKEAQTTANAIVGNARWEKIDLYTSAGVPVSYKVQHVVDGVIKKTFAYSDIVDLNEEKVITVTEESVAPAAYTGYKFTSASHKAGDKVASGTVVTLTYVKDTTQTKTIKYTVNHVVGDETVLTNEVSATVWVNDTDTKLEVTADSISSREDEEALDGFTISTIDPYVSAGMLIERDTVITLTYVPDNEDNDKAWPDGWGE